MLRTLLVILLVFIMQTQFFPLWGIRLDLFLLVTVYYGFLYGVRAGVGVGLGIGLLQDIFSGGLLGINPVGLIICGMLAGYCRRMLLLRYWLIRVLLVFIFSLLNLLISLVISQMVYHIRLSGIFADIWLPVCAGNTIIAGLIFWIGDRYE